MMLTRLWTKFDNILFRPSSTDAVCVFRIGVGLCLLASGILRIPDFWMWYGENGITPYDHLIPNPAVTTRHTYASVSTNILSIWSYLAPTNHNVEIVFFLFVVSALAVTIGFCTRVSAFSAYLLYICLRVRNPFFWFTIDLVARLFLPIMIFAPAGEKFSVDQLIRKKFCKAYKENLYGPWVQRLLQLAVATIYFRAFTVKIFTKNWLDGTTALNYSIHSEWIKHGLPSFLETKLFYTAATWMTLGIEFSLFTLIWFKKTRYWTLLIGVFFHIALNYSLNIDFLQYAMIASYILFIYPEDLQRISKRLNLTASPQA